MSGCGTNREMSIIDTWSIIVCDWDNSYRRTRSEQKRDLRSVFYERLRKAINSETYIRVIIADVRFHQKIILDPMTVPAWDAEGTNMYSIAFGFVSCESSSQCLFVKLAGSDLYRNSALRIVKMTSNKYVRYALYTDPLIQRLLVSYSQSLQGQRNRGTAPMILPTHQSLSIIAAADKGLTWSSMSPWRSSRASNCSWADGRRRLNLCQTKKAIKKSTKNPNIPPRIPPTCDRDRRASADEPEEGLDVEIYG